MIIKKRNLRGKVEKTEPKKVEAQVSDAQISEVKNIEQQPVVEEVVQEISQPEVSQEPDIDLFDIENIDFTQRQERRRGSRRRGYRRIDDRNLVSRAQEEAETIKKSAELTADKDGLGAAKLVVFCNSVSDNPFMAGAYCGYGEPECALNIGVSGPGVVRAAILDLDKKADLGVLSNKIKQTAYKITTTGELIGRKMAKKLGIPFGVIDLSLAPTPAIGDSVAQIFQAMGLEHAGAHGTTAALAMLNDAVKKGGIMASSYVGGLSGAFIPVSEDAGMIEAATNGYLTFDKLEAMTCVCSVGLDMIAIAGDTPTSTIAGMIADEMAIGMINKKTTAVRIIPAPNKKVGDKVVFGGLLGEAPIMSVNTLSSAGFVERGGRIPAPIHSLNN